MTGNENFRRQVALLTRARIAHQHGFHKMEERCERELLELEREERERSSKSSPVSRDAFAAAEIQEECS
jgi:hypothetical protein